MKDMWDELRVGYGHLALSSQNLRDKAASLERIVGNVLGDIVRNVGRADRTRSGRGNEENAEIIAVENSDQNANGMSCEGERAQICIQIVHKIKLKK